MPQRYTPPVTQWGALNARKRAICLHGLTSSSQVWCRVAEGLVDRGYSVTAPDLLGHGIARHNVSSNSPFTVGAYVQDLVPLLSTYPLAPFDTVIGHSFGGPLALALVPFLLAAGAPNVHVVLVEPALELSDAALHTMKLESIDEVTNVRTWQMYRAMNHLWTERDAMVKNFGATTCNAMTAAEVCNQNRPWSFTNLLPSRSTNVKITILAGDPTLQPYFTPAEMQALNSARPDIRTVVVHGSSHAMPREFPDAVVDAAVNDNLPSDEYVVSQRGVEVDHGVPVIRNEDEVHMSAPSNGDHYVSTTNTVQRMGKIMSSL